MMVTQAELLSVRKWARVSVAGIGLFLAIVVLLHVVRPEYDVITRFVSEYAVSDPLAAAVAGISLGIGAMALARALTAALPQGQRPRAGIVLLWVFGVCAVGFGVFPADEFPTVNPPSWHGIIHAVLAVIGFFSFSVGTLLVSFRLRRVPARRKDAPLLIGIAALCLLGFFLLYAGLPIVGLVERLYVLVILSWMGLLAKGLLRDTASFTP
ncbi:MAG TPA: DUF998 domain-containing protein [Bacillota bacterium]